MKKQASSLKLISIYCMESERFHVCLCYPLHCYRSPSLECIVVHSDLWEIVNHSTRMILRSELSSLGGAKLGAVDEYVISLFRTTYPVPTLPLSMQSINRFLYGPTPEEKVRAWQGKLRAESRQLDREMRQVSTATSYTAHSPKMYYSSTRLRPRRD